MSCTCSCRSQSLCGCLGKKKKKKGFAVAFTGWIVSTVHVWPLDIKIQVLFLTAGSFLSQRSGTGKKYLPPPLLPRKCLWAYVDSTFMTIHAGYTLGIEKERT